MKKLKSILSLKHVKILLLSFIGIAVLHGDLKEQFLRKYVGNNTYKVISGNSSGSGFVVRYKGRSFVITNAHVCGENKIVSLENSDNVAVSTANVLSKNEDLDLCAIENVENKHGLYIQNHNSYVGQTLNIVGHPSGRALTIHSGSYIGEVDVELSIFKFKTCPGKKIEIDIFSQLIYGIRYICLKKFPTMGVAAIAFPGNSGSPVVSNFGTIAGVLFAVGNQLTDSNAIPRDRLIKFLESL